MDLLRDHVPDCAGFCINQEGRSLSQSQSDLSGQVLWWLLMLDDTFIANVYLDRLAMQDIVLKAGQLLLANPEANEVSPGGRHMKV